MSTMDKIEHTYWIVLDQGPGRAINKPIKSHLTHKEISYEYGKKLVAGESFRFEEDGAVTVVKPVPGTILVVFTEERYQVLKREMELAQQRQVMMPLQMPPGFPRQ